MKDRTDRALLLGLVLGIALCGVLWFVSITMVLFALVIPFFCGQLLLLRRTKEWLLRLLPTFPIVLLLVIAGCYAAFGTGWDTLAALVFALMSIAPAVGCVLAFLIHRFGGKLRGRGWLICAFVLLGCAGAWLGQEIALGYWDRAFIKILSFVGCAGVYALLMPPSSVIAHQSTDRCGDPHLPLQSSPSAMPAPPEGEPSGFGFLRRCAHRLGMTKPDRASLKMAGLLALAVFLFLTVGYMILSPWIDLSAIPEKLRLNDVTAENFPLVAAYITLVNSFLEEFFFRGFAFLTLRRHTGEKFAYLFSGVTFAAYHVSIMSGWFHPVWFVLFLIGLAVGGMLFDWLDRKGSLWCGWMVHAAADLAIMLIGMRMFGIL